MSATSYYLNLAAVAATVYFDPLGSAISMPMVALTLEAAAAGYLAPMVMKLSKDYTVNPGSPMEMNSALAGAAGGAVASLVSPDPMIRALVAGVTYAVVNDGLLPKIFK